MEECWCARVRERVCSGACVVEHSGAWTHQVERCARVQPLSERRAYTRHI